VDYAIPVKPVQGSSQKDFRSLKNFGSLGKAFSKECEKMNPKIKRFRLITVAILILSVTIFLVPACTQSAAPVNVQTTDDAANRPVLATLQEQLNQTATAEKNALVLQATQTAQTPTIAITLTPTQTFTPSPNLQQTQQASAMFLKIQQYASDNLLPSTLGTYQRLSDQIFYYSKPGFYKWTETGLDLDDFVFESDVVIENTTRATTYRPAGCGLLFHSEGNINYILAYIGMDGNAYTASVNNGVFHPLGKTPYGKEEPSQANAHFALVVNGINYTLFVNDKMILQSKSETDKKTGAFYYVVFSGSDKAEGTTCKYTKTDLWTVKP
jgi:hypothetical protein